MGSLRRFFIRLFNSATRREEEQRLRDEIEEHLAFQTEDNVRAGMSPVEARRQAIVKLGGVEQTKEDYRAERRLLAVEHVVQDLRFGLRMLRKSPGFTGVAVVTLALAIGANGLVFGVMDSLILRPLNVPRAESLWGTQYGVHTGFHSYPSYRDLRDRTSTFEDLAAFTFAFVGLDTGQEAALAAGYAASGNYFDVLGIQPHLGRFFHGSDEQGPNSAPYLVLSHAYWHSRFQADRTVVGRTVQLNKHPFTIIGVAPPGFRGTVLFVSPDFFMPIVNQPQVVGESLLEARGTQALFEVFGHLKPGVAPAQANADLYAVADALEKAYPREFSQTRAPLARPGLTAFGGAATAFMSGLMLLAGLILLAACANLGGLFAARAADRSREVALRLALGSSRARILQQLLTEALLISLLGGAIGLLGSVALLDQLSRWQPFPQAPVHLPLSPGAGTYVVALALALLSGALFGIVPVRQVLRAHPYDIVKGASGANAGRRLNVRDLLLVFQIAICAILVTSSLVAVRGLLRSLDGAFGFEPRKAVLVSTNLARAGYTGGQVLAMQDKMIGALEALPGVEHVGLVNSYPPLIYGAGTKAAVFKDEATDLRPANVAGMPYRYDVSPGYFRAAGTTLLAGRSLSSHDETGAPVVAVVNRAFAGTVFGSVSGALTRHFKLQDGSRVQVVGVVEDGKYLSLTETQQPAMFFSFRQAPSSQSWLVVRSSREAQDLAPVIRGRLRALDAGLPADIDTWNNLLVVVLFPSRVATLALGALGAMAALLSITGVYGMAAYSVSKRMRELGIRLALGARRTEVLQAALGRAVRLLALGSAAGLILGIPASQVLAFVVYQATPRDPLVLASVVGAMCLLGLLATWIPARRALSVDPATLLRDE